MMNFFTACIHLDPLAIVKTGSYLGIAFLIFIESGLLIGIFFPGDSILFAAGLLSSGGILSFWPLTFFTVIAAILGDSTGYWFGSKLGSTLFKREDSRFFKREYLRRTERFYQKYGGRAIVLARFVPVVRTIAPILAGASSMKYRKFISYNVIGGLLWDVGMISLGFFLGSLVPNSGKYALPFSLVIIVISFLPILLNLVRGKQVI